MVLSHLDNAKRVKGRSMHYSVNQHNCWQIFLSLSLPIPPEITLMKWQCLCSEKITSHARSKQEID